MSDGSYIVIGMLKLASHAPAPTFPLLLMCNWEGRDWQAFAFAQ